MSDWHPKSEKPDNGPSTRFGEQSVRYVKVIHAARPDVAERRAYCTGGWHSADGVHLDYDDFTHWRYEDEAPARPAPDLETLAKAVEVLFREVAEIRSGLIAQRDKIDEITFWRHARRWWRR